MTAIMAVAVVGAWAPSVLASHHELPSQQTLERMVRFETCLEAAWKERPGHATAVDFRSEEGVPQYDFDIRTEDGREWVVECDAMTGLVKEIEQKVKPSDPVFKSQVKISEADAKRKVLKFFPGKVTYTYYIIEPDGQAMYEFDVFVEEFGHIMKFEVNATTGEVEGAGHDMWEIGKE
ncbi:MAG: PepSY domain-containing protein [bacterium]|nr:PepSY domain-containing protein [bacterium]